MSDRFVYAVSKATNKKVLIPARWRKHPTFGKRYKDVPSERAKNQPEEPTGETGTEIESFQDAPSSEEKNDESPAAGEEE